jgi:hypothetical protein
LSNTSINLTSLDFTAIKTSLKTYLKAQDAFKDYDFDGSNMSVLLDILAYNTHLNSFYLNMAISEMFLDSAQLRNSLISRAKELNYTPRSSKSATAVITAVFPQTGLNTFTIPSGTRFTGKNASSSFQFLTDKSYLLYPSGGNFTANLEIFEGLLLTDSYVINNNLQSQRFTLTNDNIDTDSLVVLVSENNGANNTLFAKADSLYGLSSNSNVYFLQAAETNKYEILFGDGVFGRKPADGSLLAVQYRSCSGTNGNDVNSFTIDDNLGIYNGYTSAIDPDITVTVTSYGGANAESIESIKFNAPRHFQTQERAVTTNDFKTLVLQNFSDVKGVNVFGGETVANQVSYGTVFISPVSQSGAPLSDYRKNDIETFLKNKCVLGMKPKIINPEFLKILVYSTVKWDPTKTVLTATDLAQTVGNTIKTYNTTYLSTFDVEFKLSRLEAAINDSDVSISSNETKIVLEKDVSPDRNSEVFLSVEFRNPITPGSVTSSTFITGGRLCIFTDYNPNATSFSFIRSADGSVLVKNSDPTIYLKDITDLGYESYTSYGTIDYNTGAISLNKIVINDFVSAPGEIQFLCSPQNQDVTASKNDVILIDEAVGINLTFKTV